VRQSTTALNSTKLEVDHQMTLKQKQSNVPSKTMALQEAEAFVLQAKEKIQEIKASEGKGSIDE